MDTITAPDQRHSDAEIQETYEKLGLGTSRARATFVGFDPQPPRTQFDVVISTTSQPFVG